MVRLPQSPPQRGRVISTTGEGWYLRQLASQVARGVRWGGPAGMSPVRASARRPLVSTTHQPGFYDIRHHRSRGWRAGPAPASGRVGGRSGARAGAPARGWLAGSGSLGSPGLPLALGYIYIYRHTHTHICRTYTHHLTPSAYC